ncbi:Cysteine synthase, chloroplastic/chromoplastic [Dichanthelium oligosanthes]|uniref:Cysteine synthase, chloroplastic/chromoplastic n=1 Tax=Dichanthelium oligosanthes TaxID=888268 RepID=A0A1E5W4I3_9POAL|nr:Cysteine synthase, chloroplastic/chromoplastic [Dichanthelium oligosanthes]
MYGTCSDDDGAPPSPPPGTALADATADMRQRQRRKRREPPSPARRGDGGGDGVDVGGRNREGSVTQWNWGQVIESQSPKAIALNLGYWLQLIGWTPLIELKNIAKKDGINARLIGKIEPYQPLFSVKDRSALRLIEDAEEKSLISPGVTTLVAVTSGNLGIGMAFVAAQKGYKFIAVMPAKVAIDKQILLRYLGVEVILVDPAINGFKGLLDRVEQLKNEMENVYVVDQFTNPANPDAHFRWTGPEIWKDTEGKVDIFVAASGSGGTLTGTGRYLKMKNPSVKLICVEPAESAVISVSIDQDLYVLLSLAGVTSQEAMDMARSHLYLLVAWSSDLCATLQVAAREESKNKMIVTMFSSGGERYLNSELFAQVKEECVNMNMAF